MIAADAGVHAVSVAHTEILLLFWLGCEPLAG